MGYHGELVAKQLRGKKIYIERKASVKALTSVMLCICK